MRLGVSVGRKVGGAVERNAVKRALREAFWALGDGLPAGHDFVLVARPDLPVWSSVRARPGVEPLVARAARRGRDREAA